MNAKGLAVRWELRGLRYCGCLAGGFLTGKPLAVVAIGERAQPVLDLVRPEVGDAAELQDAVLGHGGVPHQVAARLHGNNLAAVDDRAAVHGQDVGDAVLARQRCAFLGSSVCGVRHDAAEVHDGFAGRFQLAAHLVVQAAALDGAAAERQHHHVAHAGNLGVKRLRGCALAEVDAEGGYE